MIWVLKQVYSNYYYLVIILKLIVFYTFYYCSAHCRYGDVRLADGHSQYAGRVEFCSSRSLWGAVCNTQWTEANSQIVCRSLGYSDVGEAYRLFTILLFSGIKVALYTVMYSKWCRKTPDSSQIPFFFEPPSRLNNCLSLDFPPFPHCDSSCHNIMK